ncbi:ATP-dependent DNA helicase UvrD2 [Salsipaludibacter albus]|uniref:ATP-dependent DNA helicase UvrD2 n=1 Tax=Salsipaludibacter albus TaxID=2849650 RepID=UPI001EE3B226|nr:ATP-dependent DNA helicase UvrD2 [Salsipaludibacter albus]MBY5163118.1 ATP-dependent DNA helicase UvrD2 [Salsipaludibacter albus]
MPVEPDPHYPGPVALGRGVVVAPGAPTPPGTSADAPRLVVDDAAVAAPSALVARLHLAWARREPVVVELAADNAGLREPEVETRDPWELPHGFTFERERLHFLVWANNYDARSGDPIWWHGELARRRGGEDTPDADAVVDGVVAWADGGPRGPVAGLGDDGAPTGLVHRESIQEGRPRLLGTTAAGDDLAADQGEAVAHDGGAARIIAPAGSGKTRVLTARMRHLLADRGYEPSLVTAVAYNTRAAAEMRQRLGDVPGVAAGGRRSVRTFHSLGKWICDLDGRRELIDEGQQRSILDRLVRTARIPNTDPFQAYLDALGLVRLGLVDPLSAGLAFEVDEFDDTFGKYRAELDRRNLIDFDEMIFRACELLLTRPDVRAQAQRLGTHLLVDEFQDLTPAFHLLMRLVASPSLQVFGVGDDDQVIYGYAGADPDYLIDFAADFPGAGDHPLEVNYRCPPAVVDQVATLLGHNRRRVDKQIRAGRDHSEVAPQVHAVDAGAMAARTVEVVTDRLADGAAPTDVAVLARVNATLLPVQVSLAIDGVPHTKVLDVGVLQRTGIRTALAYLRLGLDPERMQRSDIFETLNRPSRKVKSAVSDHLRGRRFSMDRLRTVSEVLSTTHATRWDDYLDDVQALSDAITDGAETAACLQLIRSRIGLGEAMDTLDASRSRPEGSSHGDDLDALAQLALLEPDPANFGPWLRDQLALPGDDDGVTLSTVHRVKGMEWDHVVVYAATDGLMPHRLAEDVEEERRVFHVAVTRCRESVAVVGDRNGLSPFVAELSRAADERAADDDDLPERSTPRVVDGRVEAVPGAVLTAPGGVEVVVRRVERSGGTDRVVVDVDGAAAHLSVDTEVEVEGERAKVVRPRRTTTSPGSRRDGEVASVSRLDAYRQQRQDRLSGTGAAVDEPDALTPEAEDRFQALRAWRTDQARDQGMPPYIIFNDRTLKAIAAAAPTSSAELARCHGVGATKLDRYGDDVLALLDDLA